MMQPPGKCFWSGTGDGIVIPALGFLLVFCINNGCKTHCHWARGMGKTDWQLDGSHHCLMTLTICGRGHNNRKEKEQCTANKWRKTTLIHSRYLLCESILSTQLFASDSNNPLKPRPEFSISRRSPINCSNACRWRRVSKNGCIAAGLDAINVSVSNSTERSGQKRRASR